MYKHLKVPELKQLCKEKGIKGYSKKKKEELLAMLNKTEAGAVITHHIAKTDPENLEGEKAELYSVEPAPQAEELFFKPVFRWIRLTRTDSKCSKYF